MPGSAARPCLSSDGAVLGTIVGIHRDPATGAARWGVVTPEAGRAPLFVPLQQADARPEGLVVPYPAAVVRGAPRVADQTRMTAAEQTVLMQHYGLAQAAPRPAPPPAPPATPAPLGSGGSSHSMVRSEEQLAITALEWRPYSRVRIRKVVRTEDVTHVITVRREELVVEDEPVNAVERLEFAFGAVKRPEHEGIDLVLHREEVVVQTRIVPYERVHIETVEAAADWTIEAELRKERIDVERGPARGGRQR